MNRTSVKSSNLVSVGFDLTNNTLEIEFKDGGVYVYKDVSAIVYQQLIDSPSVGAFFMAHVRDKYTFEKLS